MMKEFLWTAEDGIEIQITTTDVHGNSALASEVDFEFDDPLGVVTPSSEGDGYWIVEGGQTGEWNLRMRTGSAVSDITVNVSHGEPVRLLAEISENNPEEGGSMIIRIHAIDQAGNRIEVPSDEVTIKCTAGSVSHLAADTHELSIDQAGDSHSCNVYWNDLIAQRFFDVEAVLFGGGLGDSNTALTMVSMIIFLFIAIMVVLIRRMKGESQDDYEWEDEFEEEEESENVDSDLYEIQRMSKPKPSSKRQLLHKLKRKNQEKTCAPDLLQKQRRLESCKQHPVQNKARLVGMWTQQVS